GRGGMGVVFEAIDERLHRRVALKLLPVDVLADPRRVQRFEREAQAAARLHHSNVVPVFGYGSENGHHYFAMQYIDGRGLDQLLEELKQSKRSQETTEGKAPGNGTAAAAPLRVLLETSGLLRDKSDHASYCNTVARIGMQAARALEYAHSQGV